MICAVATASFAAAQNQDRPLTWVHGLGGDSTTWEIYAPIFNTERRLNGQRNTHTDTMGVGVFANDVGTRIAGNFPGTSGPGTTNLAIAHSMGGMAVRELARTSTGASKRLGGLVTVGSPNRGARAMFSVASGQVTAAGVDACAKLAAGPSSEILFIGIVVDLIGTSEICDMAIAGLINRRLPAGPSTANVTPGSLFLSTLNGSQPAGVEVISIWGNENSPVHWRMLSSEQSGGDNDTRFVHIANQMRETYNNMRIFNANKGVITLFFNPLGAILSFRRAAQWQKGVKWFDQSEKIFVGLIRCNGTQQEVTVSHVTYHDCSGGGNNITGSPAWIACVMQCNGPLIINTQTCTTTETFTSTITVNNKSDGLVCDQDQIVPGLPAANIIEARGVNHMEMRNTTNGTGAGGTDEMSRVFNLIWNRENSVFQVDIR